jgi:transposase
MVAPLSMKLRESIVRAHESRGLTYVEIADLLGVCQSTVTRVLRRHRTQGSVAPLPRGGGNFSPIRGAFEEALHRLIAEAPDRTVAELTDALIRTANIETSSSSVMRALQRLGYTRKKSHSWQASATPPSTTSVVASSSRSSR